VLAAGDGEANAAIARQVGVGVDTVRKWRKRFVAGRLVGLRDAPRPGPEFRRWWAYDLA
jgi:transposase